MAGGGEKSGGLGIGERVVRSTAALDSGMVIFRGICFGTKYIDSSSSASGDNGINGVGPGRFTFVESRMGSAEVAAGSFLEDFMKPRIFFFLCVLDFGGGKAGTSSAVLSFCVPKNGSFFPFFSL